MNKILVGVAFALLISYLVGFVNVVLASKSERTLELYVYSAIMGGLVAFVMATLQYIPNRRNEAFHGTDVTLAIRAEMATSAIIAIAGGVVLLFA